MSHHILIINPGSTSTKLGIFRDDECLWRESFEHRFEGELSLLSQLPVRQEAVTEFLEDRLPEGVVLDAVVGRGGLLPPLPAGTYAVDEAMLQTLRQARRGEHASNLGAFLADEVARERGIPAYIVDPVSVDELEDVARVSGLDGVERESLSHALNIRAVAHRFARDVERPFDELRLIVAHLGSGVSMAAIRDGRLVDVVNPRDEGPIGLDRPGALPNFALVELCFDRGMTKEQVQGLLLGNGGVHSYLQTRDLRHVSKLAARGDGQAALLLQAIIYDTAKWIGAMATVLEGELDAILLTGGMIRDGELAAQVEARVQWIAPVAVYAGEDELQALAEGGLRVLRGRNPPQTHVFEH
ncbi:MAG: butyrate kinase [Bradymonadaceae bacterium]